MNKQTQRITNLVFRKKFFINEDLKTDSLDVQSQRISGEIANDAIKRVDHGPTFSYVDYILDKALHQ